MPKLTFLGDISFNDDYIDLYSKKIQPFENIKPILENSDFVVGNLECFCEGKQGENLLKSPRIKTTKETLNYLSELNIDLVSLASNHTYDNLEDGFRHTLKKLDSLKINYLGASTSKADASTPIIKEIGGKKFAFFNYVTSDTNPNLPENATVYLNCFDEEKIVNDIKTYRNNVDYIILLPHWGGDVEAFNYPSQHQPRLAETFIKAGADLIIGHHSHTFQPFEKINGKYVFYSLGNFCFADVKSGDNFVRMGDFKSGVVEVEFNDRKIIAKKIPIRSEKLIINRDTSFMNNLNFLFRQVIFKICKMSKFFWLICYFKFRYIDVVINYIFSKDRPFKEKLSALNIKKIKRFLTTNFFVQKQTNIKK